MVQEINGILNDKYVIKTEAVIVNRKSENNSNLNSAKNTVSGAHTRSAPDPEVLAQPKKRRTLTAKYKIGPVA